MFSNWGLCFHYINRLKDFESDSTLVMDIEKVLRNLLADKNYKKNRQSAFPNGSLTICLFFLTLNMFINSIKFCVRSLPLASVINNVTQYTKSILPRNL